jgi:hypothetical protein
MKTSKKMEPTETSNAESETPTNEDSLEVEHTKLTPAESAHVRRAVSGLEPESINGGDEAVRVDHWKRTVARLRTDYENAVAAKLNGSASSTSPSPMSILTSLTSAARNLDAALRARSRSVGYSSWQGKLDAARATYDAADKSSPDLARQAEFEYLSTRLALGAITTSERTKLAALKVELGA